MLKYKLTSLLFISIIVFNGCKKSPVEVENKTPGFYAKVVDSNNNPIPDVGFHYIFYVGSNIVARNMVFSYILQSSDTITIKIIDSFNNEVTTLLDKQYQPSGNHAYVYNDSNITNGIYSCSIIGSTINQKIEFFVLTDDINKLLTLNPFKKTDSGGNIQISYSEFGIGKHFTYQTELTVADSIKIVLFKQGYKTLTQNIKLDTTTILEKTFQLENN